MDSGILTITQTGGDGWKWTNIDKYRFQKGEFYLIGFTNNYGRSCDYWESADFNISTGKITIKKEYEECYQDGKKLYTSENNIIHKRGLIITLQNRKKLNWSLQDTAIKLMFN